MDKKHPLKLLENNTKLVQQKERYQLQNGENKNQDVVFCIRSSSKTDIRNLILQKKCTVYTKAEQEDL